MLQINIEIVPSLKDAYDNGQIAACRELILDMLAEQKVTAKLSETLSLEELSSLAKRLSRAADIRSEIENLMPLITR